jgi:hypothetical protein
MADPKEAFSVKDFNFQAAGAGLNALMSFKQNKVNYKMKMANIDQKKDLNQLQLTEKQALRALETNEFLSAVSANVARRGLTTGGETMQIGALNNLKRQNDSDTINFLNEERSLKYQQNIARYEKKMADFSAGVSLITSAASMAASGGLL